MAGPQAPQHTRQVDCPLYRVVDGCHIVIWQTTKHLFFAHLAVSVKKLHRTEGAGRRHARHPRLRQKNIAWGRQRGLVWLKVLYGAALVPRFVCRPRMAHGRGKGVRWQVEVALRQIEGVRRTEEILGWQEIVPKPRIQDTLQTEILWRVLIVAK